MQSLYISLLGLASVAVAGRSQPLLQSRALSSAPTVSLKNGSYFGVHDSVHKQDQFLGMPFAQPPIGDLRFANPVQVNSTWGGALPATNYAFVSHDQPSDESSKLTAC